MTTISESKYGRSIITTNYVAFFCPRCDAKITYPKTIHDAEVKCPFCNHKMIKQELKENK